MSDREKKILAEAQRLWAASRAGPPPPVSGSDLLDLIIDGGSVAVYERLHSPHLRAGVVTWPARRR